MASAQMAATRGELQACHHRLLTRRSKAVASRQPLGTGRNTAAHPQAAERRGNSGSNGDCTVQGNKRKRKGAAQQLD